MPLFGHEQTLSLRSFKAAVGVTALPASLFAGLLWGGVADWSGFGAAAPFWFGGGMAGLAVLLFLVQNRVGDER